MSFQWFAYEKFNLLYVLQIVPFELMSMLEFVLVTNTICVLHSLTLFLDYKGIYMNIKTKRKVERHAGVNRGQRKEEIEVNTWCRRYQKNKGIIEEKKIERIEVYVTVIHCNSPFSCKPIKITSNSC
jgi:hypothetical protein